MDPAARRGTPHSGMPSQRGLPAVTKNRNYPQPVKHLNPMALGTEPDVNLRTVEALIRRWESGRTAISDKWLPMVKQVLTDQESE